MRGKLFDHPTDHTAKHQMMEFVGAMGGHSLDGKNRRGFSQHCSASSLTLFHGSASLPPLTAKDSFPLKPLGSYLFLGFAMRIGNRYSRSEVWDMLLSFKAEENRDYGWISSWTSSSHNGVGSMLGMKKVKCSLLLLLPGLWLTEYLLQDTKWLSAARWVSTSSVSLFIQWNLCRPAHWYSVQFLSF